MGRERGARRPTLVGVAVALVAISTFVSGGQARAGADRAPSALLDRLVDAYHEPAVDPSRRAWRELLGDDGFTEGPVDVLEFVSLETARGAKARYDRYLAALTEALTSRGARMITVNDTLEVGVGRLPGYADGVSSLARFPSRAAYVDAMLAPEVVAASRHRRAAVAEAQVLLGSNAVPEPILNLPPNSPASDFPSARVEGKSPAQIVDELLAIYPSGGADPTRSVLERMTRRPGFADQPLTYVNLYEYGPETGGAAALDEYNSDALPLVLAHGARPKALVEVEQHLVGPTAWSRFIVVSWPSFAVFTDLRLDPAYVDAQTSRIVSARTYGNLISIARDPLPVSG
jgi:uncharacterized protein (DUF1330 family)